MIVIPTIAGFIVQWPDGRIEEISRELALRMLHNEEARMKFRAADRARVEMNGKPKGGA